MTRRTKRRDRVDVVADILSFVKEHHKKGGVLFNHIRFGSLVSNTKHMRWYLQQLLESGHLETHVNNRFYKDLDLEFYNHNKKTHGTRFFSITEKGRRFLSLYEHVNEERVVR
jgi:predicted transcriptional regulator